MDKEEAIKRRWLELDEGLRSRVVRFGVVAYAPMPPSAPTHRLRSTVATSIDIDAIEYASGPFGTVVGRWGDVVTLV